MLASLPGAAMAREDAHLTLSLMDDLLRDRYRGAMLGLATGDALGASVEFAPPGAFEMVTTMRGGGPHALQPGQWTDDTSMALCLAESLIERHGFDPLDQMRRYVKWWQEGYLSSTGRCFDIGNTVREALTTFVKNGNPYSGPTNHMSAGNGSLMRLAPVPLYFRNKPEHAIAAAADSSRTTHGNVIAVDACRYMAALLIGALNGAAREVLLVPMYSPIPGYWDQHPLDPVIAAVAAGTFARKTAVEVKGSGYVAESLEAALWAFHRSTNFRDGCLLAVNLGNDADTTGAIFGMLAGAHYGARAIPAEWLAKLHRDAMITDYADRLFALSRRV